MIDLQVFCDGLFREPKITFSRLVVFANDNANNMENNDPTHIYTDAIAATRSAALNLDSLTTKKTIDVGSRMGGTSAKDQARRNIEIYVANHIGWARALFGGKTDPRFVATFPQGMKAFYGKQNDIFENNLDALIEKSHVYVSVLGVDFETNLNTLKAAYASADTTQGTQKTDVRTDIVTEQMAADVLSDQLTDNVLLIAHNNRRSTTAITLYFNVALLFPIKRKEIKKGKPSANTEVDICKIEYTAGKVVHILNNGATRLVFGMKLNNQKVGNTVTVEPGQTVKHPFSFFFTNGTSLYVINTGNTEGMFKMDIVM